MKPAKIFFHSNIRFLRERKQLSQEEVARLIGITRIKLQALESGRTANPSAVDFIKFSEYFKISIDALLKVDLARLGEMKLRELEAGNDVYMMGGKLRVLAITVDRDNKENVEYVPVKAKAGYVRGYNDPEFIAGLPKFNMPNLPKQGTFRMFPITGDSMLPVPDGSDVLAKFVEDWKALKPGTPCIVILNGINDFVFKLVTVSEDRTVLLESLNSSYKPYTVEVSDVLEIWQFYGYHSKQMPKATTDMQQLSENIGQILEEVRALKNSR
ncbi:MAG TPA: LexA family transcriptional regulator [Chitinophaga sp.]|uniref:XRE family transcriptional regulator n=1 Tax=Chitinophaga sp. TaxID=1869181 RepID=UPI002C2B9F5B|nr:LexA family transcriptional regulator [Chitinophaga sp.]HVI49277.1 LexA family transcriptional regulator [Chitinophaga sp.]